MPVPHVGRPLKRLEDPKLIAVLDALAPRGVETMDPPLTAAKIWQAMRSAPKGAKS